MKITFRQSGGFAGLMQGCEVDTDQLSAEEATLVQSLVEQSGLLQAKSKTSEQARDFYSYEIAIETSEGLRQIALDDASLSETAEKLLNYLQERARPRPPI